MAAGHPDNSSNLKQFQSSNRSLGIENGNWTNTSRDWRPTGPHFLAKRSGSFLHLPHDPAGEHP
jgi:hypothetical protein